MSSISLRANNQFAKLRSAMTDFAQLTAEMKTLDLRSNQFWYAMGTRLKLIKEERLYKAGGFPSFSAYCLQALGYSRQHTYKVIMVVQWIDDLWETAKMPEQQADVQRLLDLGFTKLYLLHSLPFDIINCVLKNGVTIPGNKFYQEIALPLEKISIKQLKKYLSHRVEPSPMRLKPNEGCKLSPLVKVETQTILNLVNQCKQPECLNNQNALAEQLRLIAEHVNILLASINVERGTMYDSRDSTN